MSVTRDDFAKRLLTRLPYAEPTPENRRAIIAWASAEGGPPTESSPDQDVRQARFNPLNTTQWIEGSSDFNDVGVKNYPTLEKGLLAVEVTLRGHGFGYRAIRGALLRGDVAEDVLQAVEDSHWGTGGLALQIVRESHVIRDRGGVLIGQ